MNIQEYKQNYSPVPQNQKVEMIFDCERGDNGASFWCEVPDDFARFLLGYNLDQNIKGTASASGDTGVNGPSPSQGI